MKLNFASSPVSQAAIEKALAERKAKVEESRALAYAQDVDACQSVVDAGKKHLKALRKQADEFAAEFKKLEGAESAPAFVQILNSLSIRSQIGSVVLSADYDEE